MSADQTEWYVVKPAAGPCQIVRNHEITDEPEQQRWGPFTSQSEAIARRVGLIRAGKCEPA